MATSEEIRQAAQDERDRLKLVQAGADLSAVGVAAIGALIAPPILLVALVPGVIRYRVAKELIVQERLIEDPPRPDFTEQPVPVFESISRPPEKYLDADTELLYRYVHMSMQLCGLEQAMITAIERAQGAEEAGAVKFVEMRERDARELAANTANTLRRLGRTQEDIVELIDRYPHFDLADRQMLMAFANEPPRSSSFDGSLYLAQAPDGVLASLFRMGASLDDFGGPLEARWPADGTGAFSTVAAALTDDTKAKRELAEALDGRAPSHDRVRVS